MEGSSQEMHHTWKICAGGNKLASGAEWAIISCGGSNMEDPYDGDRLVCRG